MAIDPQIIHEAFDGDSPEVLARKKQVAHFVDLMIQEGINILETGVPKDKIQLIRSGVPAAIRELAEKKTDNAIDDLRRENREMLDVMREALSVQEPIEPPPSVIPTLTEMLDGIPQDTPPIGPTNA